MTVPAHGEEGEERHVYMCPEPVTDVYLPYQGGFADLRSAMGGWLQDLYLDGDENGDVMPFTYMGDDPNGEAFTAQLAQAAEEGLTEFDFHVVYGVDGEIWAQAPEKLEMWRSGRLQAWPAQYDVTVHLRPGDLVTTYAPDPEGAVPTLWVDQGDPFEWLYLSDYDTLVQTDSPYDTPELDAAITWDEQSYLDGMASGAEQFYVTGTYTDLYGGGAEEWQYELYRAGLIRLEGEARVLVRVNDPEKQVYHNPYFPRFDRYGNVYQFHIYVRPGTGFDDAALPDDGWLSPLEGSVQDDLAFALSWDRDAYEAGLASGGESYTVPGEYGPGRDWTEEELTAWARGGISIMDDVPAPELTVHVLRDELPFTVAMEFRMQETGEGLIPVFTFPWPNGAEQVTAAFSLDGETWYQEGLEWAEDFEWLDAQLRLIALDENGAMAAIPEHEPAPFYCKLIVTGSAFAGETARMKVAPDENGAWTMEEDQGGDHGGGGQGEHDRPGKEEDDDPAPPVVTPPIVYPPVVSPPVVTPPVIFPPIVPEVPEPDPVPEQPAEPEPDPAPSVAPAPEETDPPEQVEQSGSTALAVRPDPEEPAGSPPPEGADPAKEPGQDAPDVTETPSPESNPPSASPAPEQPSGGTAPHIPGFAAAAAATAVLVLCGAGWACWRGRRK